MPYTYNYATDQPPEYQSNAFADSFNGRSGSMQPAAIANQNSQPSAAPYGKSSAYEAFKRSGMEWGGPTTLARTLQRSGEMMNTPVDTPGGGGNTGGTPNPVVTPPATTPPNPTLIKGNTDPPPPTDINPQTKRPYGMAKPPNVDQALWDTTDRYVNAAAAQGADYSFLYKNPEWITDFRNWALGNKDGASVDIVDWLARVHPEVPHGLVGRSGKNTMDDWMKTHAWNQPTTPPTTTPTTPPTTPTTTPPTTPPSPPPVTPPDTTPPPTPLDPTNWKDAVYPTVNPADVLGPLASYYGPQNQLAQQKLADILRGQAALTGDSNSGGFGDVLGRQEGQLIANQQADLGTKYQTAYENAQNRALERYKTDTSANTDKYGIDAGRFATMLQNDTQRYGIKTNADLERYLGDQKTGLGKYQIDSDSLLQRYIAELKLKGETYAVDKGFDQAALNAATQKYINDQNTNLGWGGLNLGRYGIDANNQVDYLRILSQLGLSPAQLAQILTGFTPGKVYTPPGG